MKKQLLASTLVLLFATMTSNAGMCENGVMQSIKKDFKDTGSAVKESVKSDINAIKSDTLDARKAEIEKQKKADLADIDSKIAAKQKEIDTVKKSSIPETQKTINLAPLNKELQYLKDKRLAIESAYLKKLNALKE